MASTTALKKMGRPPANTPANKLKAEDKKMAKVENMYCTDCGKFKKEGDFYKSYSCSNKHFERMTVCIDCVIKMYEKLFEVNGSQRKSIYEICSEINIPFLENTCNSAVDSKTHTMRSYITQINSLPQNKGMTFKDSDGFGNESSVILNSNIFNSEEYEEVDLEYLKRRWGRDMPPEDLLILEEKYDLWESRYDLEGNRNKEICVEQIVYEELFIFKERQQGKDVSKRLTNIQNLMKTANLSPKQESASETAEFETLGQFIKKVEQSKPFIRKNPEYEDVDNFKKIWQSLAGAIKRTAGRPDEDTAVFDEVYKDSTIDLSKLSEGDNQ